MALRPLRVEPLSIENIRRRRTLGQSDLLQHGHGFQSKEPRSEDLPRFVGEGTEEEQIEALEPMDSKPVFRAGVVQEEPKTTNLWDEVNMKYTPETQDTERFRNLLDVFPQREEPSWRRKLVAGGLGLDARQRVGTPGQELTARGNPVPTMEAAMYAPHLRNLSDWKEQTQPFYNAANLERQENIQARLHASDLLKFQLGENRLKEQENYNRERIRVADRNADSAKIRANAQMFAAQRWNVDVDGTKIIATRTNPQTGQVETQFLGDTGNVSDIDLAIIRGLMGMIGTSIAEDQRQQGRRELQEDRQAQPPNQDETNKRISAALEKEYYRNDPKTRRFIEGNIQNGFRLIEPPQAGNMWWSWSEQDVKDYNTLYQQIYGTQPGGQNQGAGARPGTNQGTAPGAEQQQQSGAGQWEVGSIRQRVTPDGNLIRQRWNGQQWIDINLDGSVPGQGGPLRRGRDF